jgi:hypothetical protein
MGLSRSLQQLNALMQQGYPVLPGCVIPALSFQTWLLQAAADLPGGPTSPVAAAHLRNPHHLQAIAQRLRRQLLQTNSQPSSAPNGTRNILCFDVYRRFRTRVGTEC